MRFPLFSSILLIFRSLPFFTDSTKVKIFQQWHTIRYNAINSSHHLIHTDLSHRAYLYNLNTPSIADDSDTMIMEWKYEMPLMLQPLLISGGFISGNTYNNHIECNDAGLYYDAAPGIENLKQFYNFLEAQPGLIKNMEYFKSSRDKLFKYLEGLHRGYFHLDMWDIFNMEDTPHAEQAKAWLAGIAHNNLVITNAMKKGDIGLLDYKALKDVNAAFNSFDDLLNYEDYAYGWSCIDVPFEEELVYEIFQENELWGLKGKDGRILLIPQFDEFFSFGPQDLAVVSKDGKYGYVNTSGRIVLPLIWDDAFDFEYSGIAVVVSEGKMGLIDIKGKPLSQFKFDELGAFEGGEGDYFSANMDGLWGVINKSGTVMMDFEHSNEIQASYGFYHIEISGKKNQKIFNADFKYLGEFPLRSIENLEQGLLLIKPHKGQNFYSIYKKDGTLLGSGFDLVVSKPFDEGSFALAFRGEEVYMVNETDIQPISKEIALKYAGEDYAYYFDYQCRKRLLVYGKAQKMNDREIQEELSDVHSLYEQGLSAYDHQDYATAIYYYTIAAKRGYTYAMNNLAFIYYNYKDFEDDAKAFYWYQKGALLANKDAMNGLGMCYKFGVGCNSDLEMAVHWLSKAAETQSALANNNLGDLYSDEDLPIFNPDQALEYYHRGADLGEPKYNWLGYLYDARGDDEKAVQFYQLAIDQGNDVSAYNLGILYANGLGTDKNVEKAIECFEIALGRAYLHAHLELARIYRNENGFMDEKKAEQHINEARIAELTIPEELLAGKKGWFDF